MRISAKKGACPTGAVVGLGGIIAGAAVGLLHLDRLPWPLCTFRALTGVPCLTCGSTRALGRLAALEVRDAFVLQPLATVAFFLLALWALADAALLIRGRALAVSLSGRELRRLGLAIAVLALANWIYLLFTLP